MTVTDAPSGPVRFARFALPPHTLGYCGSTGTTPLSDYAGGFEDPGLRELARTFDGAYPYLEVLAGANGSQDPLAADVVEAYWIGNELLGQVGSHDFANSIDDRFRRRAGNEWGHLQRAAAGGIANHAFHVLSVMPWVGLLREGIVDEPLDIVDHCRISPATVVGFVDGDDPVRRLLVRRTPLRWSGSRLIHGTPVVEVARTSIEVDIGDTVAVHWDWVCERLTPRQVAWLRFVTDRQLAGLHVS